MKLRSLLAGTNVVVTAVVLTAAAAGCGTDEKPRDAAKAAERSEAPRANRNHERELPEIPPASDSGGLCARFDYAAVEKAVGERFEVAAASGNDGQTQTCVLRKAKSAFPTLAASRHPIAMSPENFKTDFQPAGTQAVDGLGQAAYSTTMPAENGSGPRVEVGWVTADAVYTLVFSGNPAMNEQLAGKLVAELADVARAVAP